MEVSNLKDMTVWNSYGTRAQTTVPRNSRKKSNTSSVKRLEAEAQNIKYLAKSRLKSQLNNRRIPGNYLSI